MALGVFPIAIHGLQFIEFNSASVADEKQHTPIGFDIIFPGMIEYAKDLNLNLPFGTTKIDAALHRRQLELRSGYGSNLEGRKAYLAYVSEGIGKLQDWEMAMKYQRKNGSLFNSPSATAAAFIHLQDADCLRYLCSLLEWFGNAVPTVYPLDIYAHLSMVDTVERLGIGRHFSKEIKFALDETYRCWLQGEEEIFMDSSTFAMAFRMLLLNGYDVASDILSQLLEDHFCNSIGGYLKVTGNINGSIYADRLSNYLVTEVQDALNFPDHTDLDRLANRRNIMHYILDNTKILKTSYCFPKIKNKDLLQLAVEDFNNCQLIQRAELRHLGRWLVEKRLDKLNFARQTLGHCYFSVAATLFAPELSDARISWAKNAVLTTVVDDFFDVGGSEEESVNLVELVKKWDLDGSIEFQSKSVEIIFLALHGTVSEIGEKAFMRQERHVTSLVVEIWLDLLKSMLAEARWSRNKSVPTLDEYMRNAFVSFALGPILLPNSSFCWAKAFRGGY